MLGPFMENSPPTASSTAPLALSEPPRVTSKPFSSTPRPPTARSPSTVTSNVADTPVQGTCPSPSGEAPACKEPTTSSSPDKTVIRLLSSMLITCTAEPISIRPPASSSRRSEAAITAPIR